MNFFKGKGVYLIYFVLLVNLVIWIVSKNYFQESFTSPFKYLAKIASLTATLMMAFSLILTTRSKILDFLFGGLDKVYAVHRNLGRYSFFIICLHPIFLSISSSSNSFGISSILYFIPKYGSLYELGHALGVFSLLALIILVYMSLSSKIAYDLWLKSHTFFAPLFVVFIIHVLLVNADILRYPFLFFWFFGWSVLGILSYTLYALSYFIPSHSYLMEVKEILPAKFRQHEITIENKNHNIRPFVYGPGQFAHFSFLSQGLSSEFHPYSIASYNTGSSFKIGIKELGDYTKSIFKVKVGDKVMVRGPYGALGNKLVAHSRGPDGDLDSASNKDSGKEFIMIGAGIGISPMVSMWQFLEKYENCCARLYYIVSSLEHAIFDDDIRSANIQTSKDSSKRFYELYIDGGSDFFTISHILENRPGDFKNTTFFICGPSLMARSLITQLKKLGVKNSQIIIEEFVFRP